MALFSFLNCVASLIAFFGLSFAILSKHVCDGILVKKGLVLLAFGFFANAFVPSENSLIWITLSAALLVLFIIIRLIEAKAHHKPPHFLNFEGQ